MILLGVMNSIKCIEAPSMSAGAMLQKEKVHILVSHWSILTIRVSGVQPWGKINACGVKE